LGVSISNPGAPTDLQNYTTAVGRKPAIVMWFQSFDEPLFYPNQLPVVAALGAVPMITWQPSDSGGGSIPLRDIAAGNYDDYLRQAAAAAAGWGKPLFVRFAHEMNLRGSSWGPGVDGNTAADYIAAWRHVVSIFRDAGATNVLWVWSPNVECGGACPFADFYPGDAWVDWVALDGYNYSSIGDVPWMSVSEIFGSSYDHLTELTKRPIMIAETASTEVGGDKAAWITQGLSTDVPARLPRVRAVVWFQRDKETDWRVNSSAAALDAFRTVADSPLYAGNAADVLADASNTQSPVPPPVANPGADNVSVPPNAASATPSPTSLSFGSTGSPVARGTISAPQSVNVTNNGSAPLVVSGFAGGGSNPDDFFTSTDTCRGQIAPGAICTVQVRFTPQAQGSRSATLRVLSNAPSSTTIALTGTAATRATGPQGKPGKIRLVTCKVVTVKVKGHKVKRKKCTSKLVSGAVKITTTSAVRRASLTRGGVLYATGTVTKKGLRLHALRRVRAGRYTLTIRYHQSHRQMTTRSQVKIG